MKYPCLCFALLFAACAPLHPITPANRVARSAAVPHKFEPGGCQPYALAVIPRLKAAGATHVREITYRWANLRGTGAHSVVAYADTAGDWIADNERPWPTFVFGLNDQEKISCFVTICSGFGDATTAEIIH